MQSESFQLTQKYSDDSSLHLLSLLSTFWSCSIISPNCVTLCIVEINLMDLKKIYCLFDLILCVPSTIFQLNRDGFSWVEPVLS